MKVMMLTRNPDWDQLHDVAWFWNVSAPDRFNVIRSAVIPHFRCNLKEPVTPPIQKIPLWLGPTFVHSHGTVSWERVELFSRQFPWPHMRSQALQFLQFGAQLGVDINRIPPLQVARD